MPDPRRSDPSRPIGHRAMVTLMASGVLVCGSVSDGAGEEPSGRSEILVEDYSIVGPKAPSSTAVHVHPFGGGGTRRKRPAPPKTTMRAAVASATNLPVGTVNARVIWHAPSSASASPMMSARVAGRPRPIETPELEMDVKVAFTKQLASHR